MTTPTPATSPAAAVLAVGSRPGRHRYSIGIEYCARIVPGLPFGHAWVVRWDREYIGWADDRETAEAIVALDREHRIAARFTVRLAVKFPDRFARLITARYATRPGDVAAMWQTLVVAHGPQKARDYLKRSGGNAGRVLGALAVPHEADLQCAQCGIALRDTFDYARPHADRDGTRCVYLRIWRTYYYESQIADGDIPRDDTTEEMHNCAADDDGSALQHAVSALRELRLTSEGGTAGWFYDVDGSYLCDYVTGRRCETTAHLYGFTDAETAEIFRTVG